MNLSKNNSLILLHIIIIIWGFTGILGKLITLESFAIVLNRMSISFIALFFIKQLLCKNLKTQLKDIFTYGLIGLLIAIHWISFFEAIKQSTVSLALICLSSISLFTAIIEPLVQGRKIRLYELMLSIFVIIGITIVFNYETMYKTAIILSIISALFAALFTVFNHKLINNGHHALIITTWEMLGGSSCIAIYMLHNNKLNLSIIPQSIDIIYILILSLICTAFAFCASIEIMKKITPFTVNLSVNLEPIYSIILAIIIFGEEEKMSNEFYIGSLIIICSIVLNTIIKHYKSVKIN